MSKPDLKKQMELAEQALQLVLRTYIEIRMTDPDCPVCKELNEDMSVIIGKIDDVMTHSVRIRSNLEQT